MEGGSVIYKVTGFKKKQGTGRTLDLRTQDQKSQKLSDQYKYKLCSTSLYFYGQYPNIIYFNVHYFNEKRHFFKILTDTKFFRNIYSKSVEGIKE